MNYKGSTNIYLNVDLFSLKNPKPHLTGTEPNTD